MGVCEYMYGCDLLEMSHGVDTLVDHSFVGGSDVGVLLADGFEGAFLGFGTSFTTDVAVYDYGRCIEILEADMLREDAEEYFEFNVRGAYVGVGTPVFMTMGNLEDVDGL